MQPFNPKQGSIFSALGIIVIIFVLGVGAYYLLGKGNIHSQQTPTPQTQSYKGYGHTPPPVTQELKPISLADKYIVEVPIDFTVTEVSKAITTVSTYTLKSPDGHNIIISVHPYTSAGSQIPGKCVVSNDFDAGTLSAPIFCDGLNLVDSFTIFGNRYVKYGTVVHDTSMDCTMNSPCPIKVPAAIRYSKEYVFVVPDKTRNVIVEFFAGDAARGPSNTVNGFEGISATLQAIIIGSLVAK